jgi:hypothetical protein
VAISLASELAASQVSSTSVTKECSALANVAKEAMVASGEEKRAFNLSGELIA